MVEIKVNIELGVNAELKEFVTNLLMAPSVHTGMLTVGNANKAVAEHLTKPRHRAAAMAALAPEEKVEQEAAPAPEEKVEQEAAPTEQTEQEQPKSAITLPDLREAVKRLYNGGAHKEELPIIFGQFGVKNVTEVAEDKYQELFDTLNAKSEELGL